MIGLEDVVAARARIADVIRHHPTEASSSLSALAGRPVLAKPEHLQRTGSFKIRGATNRISQLAARGLATEIVASSAGNHAQGVALASTLSGLPCTIFMPAGASLPKIEATEHYGAVVHLGGETVDDCSALARAYASEHGATYVAPFDDPDVLAGQGTIGLEVVEEAPESGVVVVPVGGGGLIAGIATAVKALAPTTRVVGVEAEGAAAMLAALGAHHPVALERVQTIADGIAVRQVSALALEHVEALVDEVVTVSEEEISRAILVLLERCKWVVEPAGAVAVAALLEGRVSGQDPAVAIVSGGNVDPLLLGRLIEHGLSAAGRFLMIRVVLDDRPGSLATLLGELAKMELNVLDVDHHRSGAGVGMAEVEVVLTTETRDPQHRDTIVDTLRAKGFRARPLS